MGKDVKIGIGVALGMVLLVFIVLLARSGEDSGEPATEQPSPAVGSAEEQWTSLEELELVKPGADLSEEREVTLELQGLPQAPVAGADTAAGEAAGPVAAALPAEGPPPSGEALPVAPEITGEAAPVEVISQAAPQPQTYTTQSGDNLWKLAQRFYGDGRRWKVIYQANRDLLPSSSEVPVGVVLVIPVEVAPRGAAPPARLSAEAAAPAEPQPGATSYTVQRGDTLFGIARKHYGDGNRWRLLYEANRDRIADPNRLAVGTVLVIPPAPGSGE